MRITVGRLKQIIAEEMGWDGSGVPAAVDVHGAYAAAWKGLEKIETLVAHLAARPDLADDYRRLGPIKDDLSRELRALETRLPAKRASKSREPSTGM